MSENVSPTPGPISTTANNESKPKENLIPSILQLSIILVGSLGHISIGMGLTWPNTLTSHLMTDNTTLLNYHIQLSDNMLDWTGSLNFLSMSASFLAVGWLVGRFGRRLPIILANIPFITSWFILAFASDAQMILVGRCIFGAANALLALSVRVYMSEIANTNIRGMVITYIDVMKGVGSALTAGLGTFLPWYHIAIFNIGVLCIFCSAFVFIFPESPNFLVVSQRESEALQVLRRLRPSSYDVEEELKHIQFLNKQKDGQSRIAAFFNWNVIKRGSVIIGLLFFYGFSGSELIKANLTRMMHKAGISLNLDLSSVIVISVMFCSNLLLTCLVDRLGRRKCLIISLVLLATIYTVLGTLSYTVYPTSQLDLQTTTNLSQFAYDTNPRPLYSSAVPWVTLVCFIIIGFGINFGIGVVGFMMAVEYFPTNIRAECASLTYVFGSLFNFVAMQLYSVMMETLAQSGFYWCYGAVSALGVLYVCQILQETSQIHIG